MTLRNMIDTLPVPVDVDILDQECSPVFNCSHSTKDCCLAAYLDLPVIRWWPESLNRFVVFIDRKGE